MLTEFELHRKREHKALLRRGGAPERIVEALSEYEYPERPAPLPVAPPSVVNAKPGKPGLLGGFFRRIFNRKV